MQDRPSEYTRGDARTLPRRPLAPTQRRITPSPFETTDSMTAMDATAPAARMRADSAARALTSYSGASAMGAPTMNPPLTIGDAQSGGIGQAIVAPGAAARAVPYLP